MTGSNIVVKSSNGVQLSATATIPVGRELDRVVEIEGILSRYNAQLLGLCGFVSPEQFQRAITRIKKERLNYKKVMVNTPQPIERKMKRCSICGNDNPANVFEDRKTGDYICLGKNGTGCGNVLDDCMMDKGPDKRNFEGEDERNHHGPLLDSNLPDFLNLQTVPKKMVGNVLTTIPSKDLQRAMEHDRKAIDARERGDLSTGIYYKEKQIQSELKIIDNWVGELGLHKSIVDAAQKEFTCYRRAKDKIFQLEIIRAACIALACEEIVPNLYFPMSQRMVERASVKPSPSRPTVDVIDPAISTLGAVPMKSWNVEQVHTWLTVLGSNKIGSVMGSCVFNEDHLKAVVSSIVTYIQDRMRYAFNSSSGVIDQEDIQVGRLSFQSVSGPKRKRADDSTTHDFPKFPTTKSSSQRRTKSLFTPQRSAGQVLLVAPLIQILQKLSSSAASEGDCTQAMMTGPMVNELQEYFHKALQRRSQVSRAVGDSSVRCGTNKGIDATATPSSVKTAQNVKLSTLVGGRETKLKCMEVVRNSETCTDNVTVNNGDDDLMDFLCIDATFRSQFKGPSSFRFAPAVNSDASCVKSTAPCVLVETEVKECNASSLLSSTLPCEQPRKKPRFYMVNG